MRMYQCWYKATADERIYFLWSLHVICIETYSHFVWVFFGHVRLSLWYQADQIITKVVHMRLLLIRIYKGLPGTKPLSNSMDPGPLTAKKHLKIHIAKVRVYLSLSWRHHMCVRVYQLEQYTFMAFSMS